MAIAIAMPKLGLLMTEGTVVKWLAPDNQPVELGAPIVDVMTKKITYRIVAPARGVLHQVTQVNDKVMIGEPLAFILAPGDPVPVPRPRTPLQSETPLAAPRANSLAARPVTGTFVVASPWARRLAGELGVNLADLRGTGPDGLVVGRDVLRFDERRRRKAARECELAPPATAREPGRVVPFTGMRREIADRMTESLHTMAQATLNVEVDVTDLLRRRKQAFSRSGPDHVDAVIKAVAHGLRLHPQLNAILLGDEIEWILEIDIGFAVQLDQGLLVPVIRRADRLSLQQIAEERRRLAQAARAGTLTVDDVTGSTFTVTDLGVHGIDFFVPIINPPEAAILGIGRIIQKPVVYRGRITGRSMMMLCLAFDHRVVDGVPAATFLGTVSKLLDKPATLFA